MRRLLAIPVILIGLLALAMHFSGGVAEPKPDFVFITRADIKTLDPNHMSWLQDIRIAYCIWEGLYTLDPATLQPIPGAAQKIDLSDDKTTYTFHLRPEGKWHNGDQVVADDFVFAWRRMLESPGDYSALLFRIRGASQYSVDFTDGKKPDFKTVGIAAIEPLTLKVTLEHPVSYFPDLLAFPPFFPLNERSMANLLEKDKDGKVVSDAKTGLLHYDQRFTRPPALVGNGPYRLDQWQFKTRLRLVAAETYWNRANVQSKIIDQLSIEEPMSAVLTYDTGSVDWVPDITGDLAAEMKAAGRKDLHVFPGFGTYFYSINCGPKLPDGSPNPFTDVRVRQAFCMAVDKRPIVEQVTRLGQPVATQYIPPGVFAKYQSPPGQPYDVARARQLFAEAGYPNGKGFPRISILYDNQGEHAAIAQVVRKQLEDILQISIDLSGVENKTFGDKLRHKQYIIARANWIGDYDDASTFTDKYTSDSENNDADWKSKAYDDLCKAAEVEPDPAARLKLLAQAEKILLDECPIIPIYHYVNAYLYRDSVTGIPLNPRNMVLLQAAKVKR